MSGAIRIVDTAGNPVTNLGGGTEVVVEMVLPGGPDEPVEVEISSASDTETVTLRPTWVEGDLVVYRSDPVALADSTAGDANIGLWFDSGEVLSIGSGDTSAEFVGYETTAEARIADCQELLAGIEMRWIDALRELESLEPRTDEVQDAIDRARDWLRWFSWARAQIAVVDEDVPGRTAYIGARLLDKAPTDPVTTILGNVVPYDERDYRLTWIYDWKQQYREQLHDSFTDMMATITIGSYREFTQQTGTAQAWTILTGTNEMGEEASRFAAAGELALDFVVGRVAQGAIRRVVGDGVPPRPRTEPRSNPRQQTTRVAPGDPKQDIDGAAVDHADYGIRSESMRIFRQVADEHGVTFVIRPANVDAMRWQGLGSPQKGTDIKVKTVNEVDFHLGVPRTPPGDLGPDAAGLVWTGKPTLPWRPPDVTDAEWRFINDVGTVRPAGMDQATWEALREQHRQTTLRVLGDYQPPGIPPEVAEKIPGRFVQRQHELADNAASLEKLEAEGKIRLEDGFVIDTGLYGGSGKPITGDIDHFVILDRHGNPLPAAEARRIYEQLQSHPGAHALHGGHFYWPDDMPFKAPHEKEIYEQIIRGHETEGLLFVGGLSSGPPRVGHARDGAVPATPGEGPLAGTAGPTFGPAKGMPGVPLPELSGGLTAAQVARVVRRAATGEDGQSSVADLSSDPGWTPGTTDVGEVDRAFDELMRGAEERASLLDDIPDDLDPEEYVPEGPADEPATSDGSEDAFDELMRGAEERASVLDDIPDDLDPEEYVPGEAAGAGGTSVPLVAGGIAAAVLAVVAAVLVIGGDDTPSSAAATDAPTVSAPADDPSGPVSDGSPGEDAGPTSGGSPGDSDGSDAAEGETATVPGSASEAAGRGEYSESWVEDRSWDPMDVKTYGSRLSIVARTDMPPPEEYETEAARAAAGGFETGAAREWKRPAGDQEDYLAVVVADFGTEEAAVAEVGAVLDLLRANEGATEFDDGIAGAVGTTFPREVYICGGGGGDCELDSSWTAYDIVFAIDRFVFLVSLELTADAGPDEAIAAARSLLH